MAGQDHWKKVKGEWVNTLPKTRGSEKRAPTDLVKKLRNALAGGIKGKPHSSPEGQAASAGRTIKRLGQKNKRHWREDSPLKSPEGYKSGGAVPRFRSSGPEGKPHSTKEGRSAEAQRAYMRKHGPQKPRRKTLAVTDKYKEVRKKLNPFGTAERRKAGPTARGQKKKLPIITVVRDSEGLRDAKKIKGKPHSSPQGRVLSHIRTSSPFVVKKATGELNRGYRRGGKVESGWKLTKKPKTKSTLTGTDTTRGGGPDSGNVGYNKDFIYRAGKQRKKWREEMEKRKKKPDPVMTPYRAKHGIGSLVKKVISKVIKPKGVFKPKPKGKVDQKFLDFIKTGKHVDKHGVKVNVPKAAERLTGKPHVDHGKRKRIKHLGKGKAAGGRIGLQHGNRPRPQGPHTWVRKKPKGVKIAIKGW